MVNLKYMFSIIFVIFFTSCARYSLESRLDYAQELANKNHFILENIQTKNFYLRTYRKLNNNKQALRIYVEGDGFAWVTRTTLSSDPTPIKPIALELASSDKYENLAYIARPCQYVKNLDKKCSSEYWSNKRFSKEVISSINEAIDVLKAKQKNKNIELIGFSGGGAIVTLVAAKRKDVVKITTIAGNLNHKLLNEYHNVSQMKGSLNPIDIASKISYIPQLHLVGGDDKIMPPLIAKSFKKASKNPKNIKIKIIPNVTHTKGWKLKYLDE